MKGIISLLYIICLSIGIYLFPKNYRKKKAYRDTFALMFISGCVLNLSVILCINITNVRFASIPFSLYFISYLTISYGFFLLSKDYTSLFDRKKTKSIMFYANIILYILCIVNIFTNIVFDFKVIEFAGESYLATVGGVGLYIFQGVFLFEIFATIVNFVKSSLSCATIYRFKYNSYFFVLLVQLIFEILTVIYEWPIFIKNVVLLPELMLMAYSTMYYAQNKLTQSTLLYTANSMNELLILFDERDDMIFANERIRQVINPELLDSFKTKSDFVSWIQDYEEIEDMMLKSILVNGNDLQQTKYFSVEKHDFIENSFYIGTCFIMQDVTSTIEKLQEVKAVNDELDRSARLKSDFLANMSHEIRTPMNAVIGMAEMALREDMTDQARAYVSQIKTSGKGLLNIINDILDFSKIESGKMDIVPTIYEPLAELDIIANTLVNRIGDKDIELIIAENPKLPSKLEGDILRIHQIVINLANNAIKFTDYGRVQINCDFEYINDSEINLNVHVIDTGKGIKKEEYSKIFESFHQLDSKRNRNVEGTGLGLAISKSLVETMGGKLGFNSEYGSGSDFYFSIPQKVIDSNESTCVTNSETIFAFGLFQKKYLARRFFMDSNTLGVFSACVKDGSEYPDVCDLYSDKLKDKRRIIFFEEYFYTSYVRDILLNDKDLLGVMLADYGSVFVPDIPNLRIIKKPFSTMAIARAYNNQVLEVTSENNQAAVIDFTAPTAKVLIVDDNKVNLTVAEGLLEPLKMQIFTATSGQIAIDMIAETRFDLVFMDHMMPEMDGVEATHIIRKSMSDKANMPIIALTANAINGAKEFFLKEGMNDFVPKPIEIRDIMSKVRHWLPEDKIIISAQTVKINDSEEIDNKIPNLDSEQAIKMIGSTKLYFKILNEYFKNINKNYIEIEDAYNNKDWLLYTTKVHALKSSSKQIGAVELSEKAASLEAAGNALDIEYIEKNTADVLDMYIKLRDILAPYCEDEIVQNDMPSIERNVLIELLIELKEGCDNLDMDVLEEIVSKLKGYSFDNNVNTLIQGIINSAELMDVEKCIELVNDVLDIYE